MSTCNYHTTFLYDGQYNIKQTVQCNLIKLGTHVALVKLMCRQNGELHVWTCHPYGIMEYIPLYVGRCQFKSDWGIHLYMYNLYCLHVNYYHLQQTCKIQQWLCFDKMTHISCSSFQICIKVGTCCCFWLVKCRVICANYIAGHKMLAVQYKIVASNNVLIQKIS